MALARLAPVPLTGVSRSGRLTRHCTRSPLRSYKPLTIRPVGRALHRCMATKPSTVATDLDVAIIGGGPAGLAAAHALNVGLPHLRVAVLERIPELLKRGAGFALETNGQKALQAINPELLAAAEASGVRLSSATFHAPDGTVVMQMPGDPANKKERFGFSTFMMAWSDLQLMLAQQLPDSVPLHLGQQLERYEEQPDGSLLLHLTGQDPVRTQLLVAADGYFSRVRQQCLADGPPAWAGQAIWRARVSEDCEMTRAIGNDKAFWYRGDSLIFVCCPISGGQVFWTAFAEDARLQEAGIDFLTLRQQRPLELSAQAGEGLQEADQLCKAAKERCLRVFAKYPEIVTSLIRDTPDSAVVEHGMFVRAGEDMAAEWYGSGRVVLVGDAAHPMWPTGQGLNQALEDAYYLGHALAQAGGIEDTALQAFRSSRAEHLAPIMIRSGASMASAYKKDAAVTGTARLRPGAPADYDQFLYGIQLEPLSALACKQGAEVVSAVL